MYSSTRYSCAALSVLILFSLSTANASIHLRKITEQHERSLHDAESSPKITARRLHGDVIHGGYELCTTRGEGGCVQPVPPHLASSRTKVFVDTCEGRGDACVWYVEEIEGYEDTTVMFKSLTDSGYCMQAGLNGALIDGKKVRYMPCDPTEKLQHFVVVDGMESPIIKPVLDTDLCLTAQGDPNLLGATLIMKDCDIREEEWIADSVGEFGDGAYYELGGAYGCVKPSRNKKEAIIDSCLGCGTECYWFVEYVDGEDFTVAFHNGKYKDLCMQAGKRGAVIDGKKIRLKDCDSEEPLQYFMWEDYEAPIKIKSNTDLCVVAKGVPASYGANLIAKDCEVRNDEWSGDEIDDDELLDELD